MRSFLRFEPFYIYNILLLFVFSVIVNGYSFNFYVNLIFYNIFHLLIIYLSIYYYKKLLYFIFFIYGLGLDIFWLNEVGPHLIVFMIFLIFINFSKKIMHSFNSFKIYFSIIIIQAILIGSEMILAKFLFGSNYSFSVFLQIIFLCILLSFPTFILFSKIDKIK